MRNLAGNVERSMLATFAVISIPFIIAAIIGILGNIIATTAPIIGVIIGISYIIIVVILGIIFRVGTCKLYLNINRHLHSSISDIFVGFKGGAGCFIIADLLNGLISFLCMLPFMFFTFLRLILPISIYDRPLMQLLISLLLFVPRKILLLYFTIGFSMTQFILIDDYSKTAIDGMKESWRLMKCNKGRHFYISISFLGWYILAFISCFLGYLLLIPYINCTYANFYLDLLGTFDTPDQAYTYTQNIGQDFYGYKDNFN